MGTLVTPFFSERGHVPKLLTAQAVRSAAAVDASLCDRVDNIPPLEPPYVPAWALEVSGLYRQGWTEWVSMHFPPGGDRTQEWLYDGGRYAA